MRSSPPDLSPSSPVSAQLSTLSFQSEQYTDTEEDNEWYLPRVLDTSVKAMQEIDRVSKQQLKLLEGPETVQQRKVRENKEKREREKEEKEAKIGTPDLADVSGIAMVFLHVLTTVTEGGHVWHSKAEKQGQGGDCREESRRHHHHHDEA